MQGRDDEGGRLDVAMEVAARNPIRFCSIWWFQLVVGGETRAFSAQGS